MSKGDYDTDFSFMNSGSLFPSKEIRQRNSVYRWRAKEFSGQYADGKCLIGIENGVNTTLNYKTISTNYFKLLTNKMGDLVFNNNITIRSGNITRDKKINKLVESTNWCNDIRSAFKKATIYGDACIKTYAGGISAFSPLNCFKVVDEHDVENVLGYVMYEFLYTSDKGVKHITHIRFEINFKGRVFEQVRLFSGCSRFGTVGSAVDYTYKDRIIPKTGVWYDTGVDDCELVQWLTINQESDGVYGESLYCDIEDVVFAVEQRLSSEYHGLNNLQNPFLVLGASAVQTDQATGERSVKLIDNKIMIQRDSGGVKPEFIAPEYKLEASETLVETLRDLIYELSELSRSYLSGQYSGNPSEESINNLIKSAIDKGNRLITEMMGAFKDSLYVLCRLNGINIAKEELTLDFNVGRADDGMTIMNVCEKAVSNKILSRATLREKYYGYTREQSEAEERQIELENSGNNDQLANNDTQIVKEADSDSKQIEEIDNKNDKDKDNEKENSGKEIKEEGQNEVE